MPGISAASPGGLYILGGQQLGSGKSRAAGRTPSSQQAVGAGSPLAEAIPCLRADHDGVHQTPHLLDEAGLLLKSKGWRWDGGAVTP